MRHAANRYPRLEVGRPDPRPAHGREPPQRPGHVVHGREPAKPAEDRSPRWRPSFSEAGTWGTRRAIGPSPPRRAADPRDAMEPMTQYIQSLPAETLHR